LKSSKVQEFKSSRREDFTAEVTEGAQSSRRRESQEKSKRNPREEQEEPKRRAREDREEPKSTPRAPQKHPKSTPRAPQEKTKRRPRVPQEHSQEWLCHRRIRRVTLAGLKTGTYREEKTKRKANSGERPQDSGTRPALQGGMWRCVRI
jgi:hypothetical protein